MSDCHGGVCDYMGGLCSWHMAEVEDEAYGPLEEAVRPDNETYTRGLFHAITARLRRGTSRGA